MHTRWQLTPKSPLQAFCMAFIFKQDYFKWVVCSVLVVSGIVLLFLGFFSAPIGIIDNSVVSAFGMILTFVGGIFGMDYKFSPRPSEVTMKNVEDCIARAINNKVE